LPHKAWRVRSISWIPTVLLALIVLTTGCTARNAGLPAHAPAASSGPATPTPTKALPIPAAPVALAAPKGTGPAGSLQHTGTPAVALTFDDGPDPNLTPQLLDLLRADGVKATFCVIGKQAKKYPALIRRMVAEGHTLCDHTYSHQDDLGKQPTATMVKELQDTLDAIHAAVPTARVEYFRAPAGNFTPELVEVARRLGMTSIYWAVDPRDWDAATFGTGQAMVDHVVSTVQARTRPGSIVLSHDFNKPDTIASYRVLLPWLKARFTLECLPVVPV
jgi:peptidoglycan-N-acetylglucosamine deacetylase